jgi:UDP-N-acetylmuramoyl-tripeptide--D-alanyl-D-alanine ligase
MIPIRFDELLEVVDGTPSRPLGNSYVRQNRQLQRVVTDSRCVHPGDLFVALAGSRHHGEEFLADAASAGATAAVVERDGARCEGLECVRVGESLGALWRLAAWNRDRSTAERIAVTGSFAKTTTRQMIQTVLSVRGQTQQSPRNYNNHVGVPLSLLAIGSQDRFAVIEVAASGLGEIEPLAELVRPAAAVLTGCGRAHLHGFGSVEALSREKMRLLGSIQSGGLAVIPAECRPRLPRLSRDIQVVTVGVETDADIVATAVEHDLGMLRFEVSGQPFELPVAGRHFVRAALAAVAIGRWSGISDIESATALASFETEAGRCRVEHTARGTVIDDSYNASPESMLAACELLEEWNTVGRRVFVVGDMAELGSHAAACHAEVGAAVGRGGGIDELWAAGNWAESTVEAAIAAGMARETTRVCRSVDALLVSLPGWMQPGDTLLVKGSRLSRMERVVQQVRQVDC